VRVVLCDEDALLREMEESLITRLGHEIVGIADTTSDGVSLIHAARPDLVVFDMSLGYNTDFDVIEAALAVDARTIVFSHTAEDAILSQYEQRPIVVEKPNLVALEDVLVRLAAGEIVEERGPRDRRVRPERAATGPPPLGVEDALAFYEALAGVAEGDVLLSLDVAVDGTTIGQQLLTFVRDTDRLLASLSVVRVLLPGAGEEGVRSFVTRLAAAGIVPPATRITSVVVQADEASTDAFERLKAHGEVQQL
jgi:CheY-like chemotaxis protein